jgi:hypothetical protein
MMRFGLALMAFGGLSLGILFFMWWHLRGEDRIPESNPGFSERMRAVETRLKAGGGVLYEVRDGALHKVRRNTEAQPHDELSEPWGFV